MVGSYHIDIHHIYKRPSKNHIYLACHYNYTLTTLLLQIDIRDFCVWGRAPRGPNCGLVHVNSTSLNVISHEQ